MNARQLEDQEREVEMSGDRKDYDLEDFSKVSAVVSEKCEAKQSSSPQIDLLSGSGHHRDPGGALWTSDECPCGQRPTCFSLESQEYWIALPVASHEEDCLVTASCASVLHQGSRTAFCGSRVSALSCCGLGSDPRPVLASWRDSAFRVRRQKRGL